MNPPKDPLIAIVGATGTGKSKLAVDLALRFNGEIINGDAMQMYKGLPIITNKITSDEARGVPHHLLDRVSLSERPWNVSNFTSECLKLLAEIRSRGRLPILVGGTHYYTHALLFKNSLVNVAGQGPDAGAEEKHETSEEKEARWPILKSSPEELYAKLKEVDPVMARRWHPKNTRRVRRSLEIWLETGRLASEIYEEQKTRNGADNQNAIDEIPPSRFRFPTLIFWIRSRNDILRPRLDQRVDQMVETGLLTEVEQLMTMATQEEDRGITIDRTSGIWASIGFKEVEPFVHARTANPSMSSAEENKLKTEAVELTKIATRQYAVRQEKWIKYRFMDAIEEAGESGNVFPVDSTNVDNWEDDVQHLSEGITAAFLEGRVLPDPKSVSVMASELLTTVEMEKKVKAQKRTPEVHHCEVCDKFLMTRGEWEAHLQSRGHKKNVRFQARSKLPSPPNTQDTAPA